MSSVKIQGSATGTAAFTIAVPAGTSTDRTIELPDAAGSFVLADASGDVAVSGDLTVDTSTLYVDSANNRVGVGTASPSVNFNVKSTYVSATTVQQRFEDNTGAALDFGGTGSGEKWINAADVGTPSTGYPILFKTGGTERARIKADGNTYIGRAGYSVWTEGFGVESVGSGSAGTYLVTAHNSGSTSGRPYHYFFYNNNVIGSITQAGTTGVAYNTSSDYRLKENVTDLTGAIDRVKQVPVHRFNFIADPDRTVDGFLAHEVADVVPEAITGEKDGMKTEEYEVTPAVLDDNGNVVTEAVMGTREVPEYQGIDQSKLVPLLTAAIKEQQALIEDLQTRLAALEAV